VTDPRDRIPTDLRLYSVAQEKRGRNGAVALRRKKGKEEKSTGRGRPVSGERFPCHARCQEVDPREYKGDRMGSFF